MEARVSTMMSSSDLLLRIGTMHFPIVHLYFLSESKVIKGVKRSNSFLNKPNKTNYFKWQKQQCQRVLHGQRCKSIHGDHFDLSFSGQRSKEVKIRKYLK